MYLRGIFAVVAQLVRARPCRLLQLPRESEVETLWDIGEG